MFHVELAPLEGIFGPLKSDLGVFWPFRATDFIMGILKIWDNFLGPHVPILRLMFLEFLRNLWTFGINKKDGCFFSVWDPFRTHVSFSFPGGTIAGQSCLESSRKIWGRSSVDLDAIPWGGTWRELLKILHDVNNTIDSETLILIGKKNDKMKLKVRAVGKGLIELGLEPFHTVAILGHNDPAWHIRSIIFEKTRRKASTKQL